MNICAVGKRKMAINMITKVPAKKLQVSSKEEREQKKASEKKKLCSGRTRNL